MGKFLNTTYNETVEELVSFHSDLLNNPFYKLNDRKPTFVTYYNIDKELSAVDPGSKLQYDNAGSETPMRWNRIDKMMIFGVNKIELVTEIEEFGLEAAKIEGEAYIMPNTIIPYEGDYFEIEHVKDSTWLFIVKDVQKDTLNNGANAYRISYSLEYGNHEKLEGNIHHDFTMIEKREGTEMVSIVRNDDLEKAKVMDRKAVKLKKYYNEMFYDPKVQTFIFESLTEYRIYCPYMIEFLIRNKILDNGDSSYIYVNHVIPVNKTFAMDYDRTFLRKFELRDMDHLLGSVREATIDEINEFGTAFYARWEPYFKSVMKKNDTAEIGGFHCFDDEYIFMVKEHELIEKEDINIGDPNILWKNIIVKFFYDDDITYEELDAIDELEFDDARESFYLVPILIFCLEYYIQRALK